VSAYFKSLALPAPKIVVVGVDGAKNSPTGDPNGPDGEVLLDIEVAAAVAPGATIVVYFAPNTDKGFLDAIATAVHDTKNKPGVISISWGAAEIRWTPQSMTALDEACQAAAALGITITVAAGDNGSADSVSDGKNHADFPASSPHVLGCGGTKLIASATSIASEVVWNEGSDGATGGGVSNFFPLPTWQQKADPTTGYKALVDGTSMVIGGTSAVAPLWAGLITLCNAQNKSTAGFINPLLYATTGSKSLRDIVKGNNGAFKAKKGWDACSGLGSPIGTRIASTLQGSSATPPGKSARKAASGKSSKNKKLAKSATRVSSTKR
jgi:kumamolisin